MSAHDIGALFAVYLAMNAIPGIVAILWSHANFLQFLEITSKSAYLRMVFFHIFLFFFWPFVFGYIFVRSLLDDLIQEFRHFMSLK